MKLNKFSVIKVSLFALMHYLHALLALLVVVVSVGVLLLVLAAELLVALRQQVLVRQVAALLVTLERSHEL